jgi:hypothetical protein
MFCIFTIEKVTQRIQFVQGQLLLNKVATFQVTHVNTQTRMFYFQV